MLSTAPDSAHLATVISQVAAPAFLLSAVASLLSVLNTRMSRIVDRSRSISAFAEGDPERGRLIGELPNLRRRAALMQRAIFWSTGSGVCTCVLVIVAFLSALMDISHERGAAVLFIVAMGLFTTALAYFAREAHFSAAEVQELE